jgi:hypothetical protein
MVPLFVTQNQAIIVQYELASVWHLKTRLLCVDGAHKPWLAIHQEKESSEFKPPDPTFGQDMYIYYISHDHLKIPVYMHLYKAVCTGKLYTLFISMTFSGFWIIFITL